MRTKRPPSRVSRRRLLEDAIYAATIQDQAETFPDRSFQPETDAERQAEKIKWDRLEARLKYRSDLAHVHRCHKKHCELCSRAWGRIGKALGQPADPVPA